MLPPLNRARGWKCAAVLLAVPAVLYLRPWPWLWRWVSERFRRVRFSLAGPSASVSFKVKCYGQGKVHEDILKNLKISKCEGGAGSPCILFVYKVSRTNEDLRNALEWITNLENETTQKEDIFVAFLLEKISGESKDLGEEMITDLDVFHENTKVFRVLWKETCGSQPGFRCPEAIRTIREKINPGIEKSRSETMARLWRYVWKFGLCLGLILFFEILVQKVYCKLSVGSVECYGQGNVHKTILMDSPAPDGDLKMPCVLFVYKVSREIEDLRNALHSIQMEQKIKREDICAVILLEKVLSKCDKPVNVDHGGVFDDRSVVVRILWEKQSCDRVQKGSRYHEAMGKVIHSINEGQHE